MRYYLLSLVLMAACGSGSSGASSSDFEEELPTEIEPEIITGPTGTASYRGPIDLAFTPSAASTVAVSGTLDLDVDFAGGADAITGDASDFSTAEGGVVDGTLFLSGGALDDQETALLATSQLSGSLQSGADSYLIFGQLSGEVLGDNQSAVTGQVTGTVRQSGIDGPLTGSFQTGRLP